MSEVQRLLFQSCPLQQPVHKVSCTKYCRDGRTVCVCSAPLDQKRIQEAQAEIQDTELLCLFFLGIVILRFVSRAIWQVFDETRLSALKNLHSWNFLKSRSVESCTVMVNSFRKRLSRFWIWKTFEKLVVRRFWFTLFRSGCSGGGLRWSYCHCAATSCWHTSFVFLSLCFLLSNPAVHETAG